MKREAAAIGVIALLVLTVFGAVAITAKPADAQPQTKCVCAYQIMPLRPSIWKDSCYNVRAADVVKGSSMFIDFAQSSDGSKLRTSDRVGEIAMASGTNFAYVGVDWSLKPGISWDAVKSRPVVVTALVSYNLSGNGTGNSTSTVVLRGGDPITSTNYKTIAQAGTPEKLPSPPQANPYSVVGQKQVVWVTTLEKLSTPNTKGMGTVTVGLWTTIQAAVILQNQASGDVTVSAISLTML